MSIEIYNQIGRLIMLFDRSVFIALGFVLGYHISLWARLNKERREQE